MSSFRILSFLSVVILCVIVRLFRRDGSILSPIPLVFRNLFGWDGVISACAKRITAKDSPNRKPETHEKATFGKCLKGIGRACRREPTAGISFQGRKKFLIKPYQPNANILHLGCSLSLESSVSNPSLTKAILSSRSTSRLLLPTISLRALMTIRFPVFSSLRSVS